MDEDRAALAQESPMSDIVERLRHAVIVSKPFADNENYCIFCTIKDGEDALSEITTLRADNERLRVAATELLDAYSYMFGPDKPNPWSKKLHEALAQEKQNDR